MYEGIVDAVKGSGIQQNKKQWLVKIEEIFCKGFYFLSFFKLLKLNTFVCSTF